MGIMEGLTQDSFWKNKRVYVTGHTGFKGGWLCLWLTSMGAIVKGYSLEPYTNPSMFEVSKVGEDMESEIGDIRNFERLKKSMTSFNPDLLLHLAAQPLVRLSYEQPIDTYSTNVLGTVHVLESARACNNLRSIVSVTSDKCYENKEWYWGYRESDPMGGHDPYSNSKGCAELVSSAYRNSFFNTNDTAFLASGRAGNVIGGGDWATDRLIPDILKSFENKEEVVIRNPLAIRPWQHVLDPLSGYLLLAQRLYERGNLFEGAWNFGPRDEDCKSVEWIIEHLVKKWGGDASWLHDEKEHPHEARFLKLDCSKAKAELNWEPNWRLEHTLSLIIDWHKKWISREDMKIVSLKEIEEFKLR